MPGAFVASPPSAAPVPFLEVPNGRLFVATILHSSTIVLGLLLFMALGSSASRSSGSSASRASR